MKQNLSGSAFLNMHMQTRIKETVARVYIVGAHGTSSRFQLTQLSVFFYPCGRCGRFYWLGLIVPLLGNHFGPIRDTT